jgi:type IV secretion system protein VirB8
MNSAAPDHYFEQAEDWDNELIRGLRSQRNIWMIVGLISLLIALMAVAAVVGLTPLKRVEPIVIEVDKASGKAEVATTYDGDVTQLSVQEQLAKYFINKYLVARESHNPNLDLEDNYVLVQELSEGAAFSNYAKRFTEDAPDNPFTRYGNNTARVKISSISFLRSDTATVRYTLIEEKGQEADKQTHFIDILNYKFVNVPTDEAARLKNPLGFKVTEYRSDIEIVK